MEKLFIGGEYVDSTSSKVIEVENPATEEVIAEVPDASPEDIDRVVEVARRAQREWARTDAMTRCEILRECAQRFEDNAEEVAVALTEEGGKTLKENFEEVSFSATQFRYVAELSRSERGRVA